MNTRTRFLVGETAPDAIKADAGQLVPNEYGNIALKGFMADPMDASSEVRLDTSIEPPVLHLKNALTTTLFGYTNEQTGEFVNYTHELPRAEHIVSGQYTGPGSELDLI
jgi:hypothetical protein